MGRTQVRSRRLLVMLLLLSLWPTSALAETNPDRFSAGGYFRAMARPDFDGGWSRLGLWNLYGRLLNEGPWAALELKLDALQQEPGTHDVWTSLHAKLEGGSVHGADVRNGSLENYSLSQLYVKAGNVLLEGVTWQMGTLHTYFGDLGLYDMRPSDLFYDTVGVSALYQNDTIDLLVGFGDSGYGKRGDQYSTILTAGGSLRVRLVDGLELGVGGEFFYEPEVQGNRFAPHRTPLPQNITYEDYVRHEIVARFLEQNPGREDEFPKPVPTSSSSYKLVGYLGFGKLGPLRWNNLFVNFGLRHPDNFYTETVAGRNYTLYTQALTDQRYELNVGNEMQLALVPELLDLVWAGVLGTRTDEDNKVSASEDNRFFYSLVVRGQLYLTETVHFLAETSYAHENSKQGNLWRGHYNSVFESQDGLANSEGLEFGDQDNRNTWQLKTGFVLNPTGYGVFARPSIRLLYGLQHSTMHNAFGNSFVETLDQFNEFRETSDRNWHSVISLEAEAWF
ncbi:MAG: hypothetical protein CO108_26295 [Deltaproteobacteria bacterium CG_4_9_14_3_um_filter_63_12]|nr:MAG: hypothetical protein CO108_26295 [Deltaproteobacteria bacterium CG_4_9_14_3_um_filter_63_12]